MRYFTVRAENHARQISREADVLTSQLVPLFQELETQLKKDGFFSDDQELLKRLVPDFKWEAKSVRVQMLEKDMALLGSLEYDIYADPSENQIPEMELRSLSLWFCALKTGRICSVTFPILQIFHSVQEHLFTEPIVGNAKRKLGRDDSWSFKVFLKGDGPLYLPRKHRSSTLLIFVSSKPPATDPKDQTDSPPVEVLVTERKSLFTFEKRSLESYKATLVGIRQRGDLRVLISSNSLDNLWNEIKGSVQEDSERKIFDLGGFLLGDVYEDQDGKPFVDIIATLSSGQKSAHSFTWLLRNQPDVSQMTLEKIKKTFPGKKRVGWYHAHLDYVPVVSPARINPSTYMADVSAFDFSSSDKDLHRSMFPESWQVALVVDFKSKKLTFYQLKRGEIEPCQGYYVYDA